MANFKNNSTAMGYQNALQSLAPQPIVAQRDPTAADNAVAGQLFINELTNAVFVNAGLAAGQNVWQQIQAGGGAGNFATLHVTGLSTLTGGVTTPANLVTTGAGSITSATTVTADTGIEAITGNIVADAGDLVATLGNIHATVGQVTAGGDTGGTAGKTTLTNGSQAPGAIAQTGLVGTNGGQVNAGYLKFYLGAVAVYVPYFTAP